MGIFGSLTGVLSNLGGIIAPINPAAGGALTLLGAIGQEVDGQPPEFKLDPNPLEGESLFARYRPLWGVPLGAKGFGVGFKQVSIGSNVVNIRAFPWLFGAIKVATIEKVIEDIEDARANHLPSGPDFSGITLNMRPEGSFKSWRRREIYKVIAGHPAQTSAGGRLLQPYADTIPDAVAEAFRWGSPFQRSEDDVKDWFDDKGSRKAAIVVEWNRRHDLADAIDADELVAWEAHAVDVANAQAKAQLVAQAQAQAEAFFESQLAALAAGAAVPDEHEIPDLSILPPPVLLGSALLTSSGDNLPLEVAPSKVSKTTVAAGGLGLLLLLL
jgi:hypothetical protein